MQICSRFFKNCSRKKPGVLPDIAKQIHTSNKSNKKTSHRLADLTT